MTDKTPPIRPDEPEQDDLRTQPLPPRVEKQPASSTDEMQTAPVPEPPKTESAWDILSKPMVVPPTRQTDTLDELATAPIPNVESEVLSKPSITPPNQADDDEDTKTMPIGKMASDVLSKPLITPPTRPADDDDDTRTMPIGDLASDALSEPLITPPTRPADDDDNTRTMPIGEIASDVLSEPLIIPPSRLSRRDLDDDTKTTPIGEIASDLLSKPSPASLPIERASDEAGDDMRTMPMSTQPHASQETRAAAANTVAQRTEQRGWMQTMRRQLRTQMSPSSIRWIDVVYTPDIDKLLAQTALEDEDPAVAEQAARTIGRIRSQAAVAEIARRQREGAKGALRALAVVRDEAASLPNSVAWWARLFAWLTNTWRRLGENPTRTTWRFVFAMIGAGLAFGAYTWINLPGFSIFTPERWSKGISYGLTMGIMYGFRALLAGEAPSRMRGFHPWWGILVWSWVAGLIVGTLTWGAFTWLILNYEIDWGWMAVAAMGGTIGLSITALFRLPGVISALIDMVSIWFPLFVGWSNYNNDMTGQSLPFIYFRTFDGVYTELIPMCIAIAIGAHLQSIGRDFRWIIGRLSGLFGGIGLPKRKRKNDELV